MTEDEKLMQQALEALELFVKYENPNARIQVRKPRDGGPIVTVYPKRVAMEAAEPLRKRLAQPEMQPCAGRNCGSTNPNLHSAECFEDYEKSTGMNQWVDLTDEEMKSIQMESWNKYPDQNMEKFDAWKCQRLTQAKLKEKNT